MNVETLVAGIRDARGEMAEIKARTARGKIRLAALERFLQKAEALTLEDPADCGDEWM